MEQCAVCGTQMRPGMEAAEINYQARTYHFCSVECKQMFEKRPKDYIKEQAQAGS
ncbi:MAG TPA: YHS domain-containing protein [Chloroflexota bacterium]|jgi:YHS domain-containing protein|nr:YHS domain-containing protein [Chloroflexota bacterium]